MESRTGKILGAPEKLSDTLAEEEYPSISLDGRRMAFLSTRSGRREVWVEDLETHTRRRLTDDGKPKDRALISPDGSSVVYHRLESPGTDALWQMASSGGPARKLREGEFLQVVDWVPGGKELISYPGRQPYHFGLFDVATGRIRDLLSHPKQSVYRARISPDRRWIAFHVQSEAGGATVFVAPLEAGPPPQSRWIPIAEAPTGNVHPFWSPDGRLVYFVSNRDGFYCIWAQPLEPDSGRPVGPLREVVHLHGATRSLSHLRMGSWGLSLARNRLVFSLGEKTGSLWRLEPYR
jgi:Tol biopolymer transport system component